MAVHSSRNPRSRSQPNTCTHPAHACAARYIPFSGGPRKCVGDQFALMEAVVSLAIIIRRFDFSLVPGKEIGLTTGATIHTQNGLYMYVNRREGAGADSQQQQQPMAAGAGT